MKRKILSALLAALMLTATACGGEDNAPESSSPAKDAPTVTEESVVEGETGEGSKYIQTEESVEIGETYPSTESSEEHAGTPEGNESVEIGETYPSTESSEEQTGVTEPKESDTEEPSAPVEDPDTPEEKPEDKLPNTLGKNTKYVTVPTPYADKTVTTLISSVEELMTYAENGKMGEGKEDFLAAAAEYEDAFFENRVLAVVYYCAPTPREKITVPSVTLVDGGRLLIKLSVATPNDYVEEKTYYHIIVESPYGVTTDKINVAEAFYSDEFYFFPTDYEYTEKAQYIRCDWEDGGAPDPEIIRSVEELAPLKGDAPPEYDNSYYGDTTISLYYACLRYDEKFFEDNLLAVIYVEEGSGSIRHKVTGHTITLEGNLVVELVSLCPMACTADMAYWTILLPLPKEGIAPNATVKKEWRSADPYASGDPKKLEGYYWGTDETAGVLHFDGYSYCPVEDDFFELLDGLTYTAGEGTAEYAAEKNGVSYGINLTEGYVLRDGEKALLSREQQAALGEDVEWYAFCADAQGIIY